MWVRAAFRIAAWRMALGFSLFCLPGMPAAGRLHAEPAAAAPFLAEAAADEPITVVVVRHARPGCAAVFEQLIHDTFQSRNKTPGHLSTDFLRPGEPGGTAYTVIFKFDRMSHYRQWLASPERALWLERMAQYTDGPPQYQFQPGLEAWVSLPDEPGRHAPEKYKTVAVTWLAIFPLVLGVANAVAPVAVGWPAAATTALVTGIVVPTLGYVVMPGMSWLFRDWLYPPPPECKV